MPFNKILNYIRDCNNNTCKDRKHQTGDKKERFLDRFFHNDMITLDTGISRKCHFGNTVYNIAICHKSNALSKSNITDLSKSKKFCKNDCQQIIFDRGEDIFCLK